MGVHGGISNQEDLREVLHFLLRNIYELSLNRIRPRIVPLEFSDISISTVPPDPPSTAGRLIRCVACHVAHLDARGVKYMLDPPANLIPDSHWCMCMCVCVCLCK